MSWVAVAIGGGAAVGAGSSYLGSRGQNKRLEGAKINFEPYSGLKPPAVDTEGYKSFRPVQQLITETLMRRSQGEDVGFDPERRNKLARAYELEREPIEEERLADIQNYMSGAGLSRNLRAQQELKGRQQREFDRQRELYGTKLDIEDLSRRNQERDINTARLQALNQQNFGQENTRANFDLSQYGAEQGLRTNIGGMNAQIEQQKQNPLAEALSGGISGALAGYQMSGVATPQVKQISASKPSYQNFQGTRPKYLLNQNQLGTGGQGYSFRGY